MWMGPVASVTVAQIVEETAGHLAVVKEAKTAAGLRTLAAPGFLIDELAQQLAEHRTGVAGDREALVFVGPRGGVLRRRFGERTFAPAVVKAGLDPLLTFHGLRHAAITTMEMSDVPFDASFGTVRDQGAAREIGHDAVGVGA
jgi:integrase